MRGVKSASSTRAWIGYQSSPFCADPSVPTQKALDLFRPGWDVDERPISAEDQKTYTSRINITFRFYREGAHMPMNAFGFLTADFHPLPRAGTTPREGTPVCKCGMPA